MNFLWFKMFLESEKSGIFSMGRSGVGKVIFLMCVSLLLKVSNRNDDFLLYLLRFLPQLGSL